MRNVIKTTLYLLSANTRNIKFLTSFLLITYVLYIYVSPLEMVSEMLNLNINYGLIAVVCSDSFVLLVLFIAVAFAFSNIPFDDPPPYYTIIRSGKRKMIAAYFLYVVIISTMMLLLVLSEIMIFCRGRLYIGDSWGTVINAVANGQVPKELGITLGIGSAALKEYMPLTANIWTISSLEISFIMIGCISFGFNLVIKRGVGMMLNGLIIFMHLFCGFFPTFLRYYFSPIDWCSIFYVDLTGYGGVPGITYVCIMRGMIILLCVLMSVVSSGKMWDFVRKLERG